MLNNFKNYLYGFQNLAHERRINELIKKVRSLWQREGVKGLKRALVDILNSGVSYREWILKHDTLSNEDRILIKEHIAQLSYKPLISVLMPVYNTPEKWLRRSIESVRSQLYPHWELCIVDDASTMPNVRSVLEEVMAGDARIKVVFRSSNGHISAATNSALEIATGEFIALLDHDDELAEHAFYHVAVALNNRLELNLIYSDEDKIDTEGRRFGHYFKPDWNFDLFSGQNLISHLGVYRTEIARNVGGFREGFEGSQDWDFALRFIEQIEQDSIMHIPHVLYHWRSIPGSTAISVEEKDYAKHAAKKALEEFWHRQSKCVHIEHIVSGHFRARFDLPDKLPLVSIILISSNEEPDRLCQYIDKILSSTDYSKLEVLLVCSGDDNSVAPHIQALAQEQNIRLLKYKAQFNYSAINNWAVKQAYGEVICLLDMGVMSMSKDWLNEMASQVSRPEIGVAGGMIYSQKNKIQDAGILLEGNNIGYLYRGYSKGSAGYINRAKLVQNLSAVSSACLIARKTVWEEVGGMDVSFSSILGGIDFCLRVKEKGYRNLWTPFAEFNYQGFFASHGLKKIARKHGCIHPETIFLQEKWKTITNDPAWNPNLVLNGSYIQLAVPPSVSKPWLDHV